MNLKQISASVGGLALAIALAGPASANEYDESSTQGSAASGSSSHMESATSGAFSASKPAEELEGASIVNTMNEEIGEIEAVVRDNQTNNLHAVVGVGGYLGIGEKDITIPLETLESTDDEDKLMARTGASKEQLEAQPEYDEELYTEVPDEEVIDLRVSVIE